MTNDFRSKITDVRMARKRNDINEARQLIYEMLVDYPNNKYVLFEHALIYKSVKNYDKALNILDSLSIGSLRNICLMEIGNIYALMRKYYKAKDYYMLLYNEASLKKETRDTYKDKILPLQALAVLARKYGYYDEAITYLNTLYEIINNSKFSLDYERYRCINEMGLVNFLLGNTNSALTSFFELLNSLNPNDHQIALMEMAQIYYNDHQVTTARGILEDIWFPEYEKRATFLKGRVEFMDQNFDKAINIFEGLLNTSEHVNTLDRLICLYYKVGNLDKTREYIEEILKVCKDKKLTKRYYNIAYIMDKKEKGSFYPYDQSISIESIKRRQENSQTVGLNYQIEELFSNVVLDRDNYYDSDKYDNYYVYYPNAGTIKNENTDFLKVTTIIGTKDIMGMFPCRNLNGQMKKEPLLEYKRTIEK